MKLLENDWNAPGGVTAVEVEYPDKLIQDLVNWIRRAPAWLENPELVERRVRRFNAQLADHRNAMALMQATQDAGTKAVVDVPAKRGRKKPVTA